MATSPVNSRPATQERLNQRLEYAIAFQKPIEEIRGLLEQRAEPVEPKSKNSLCVGFGTIDSAIYSKNSVEVVQLLLDAKGVIVQPSENDSGTLGTALVQKCDAQMIRCLLNAKANVNETVLSCASRQEASPEIMQLLRQPPGAREEEAAKLKSALNAAAQKENNDQEILSLLAQKAAPTSPEGMERGTLYHAINNRSSDEVVEALLNAGAQPDGGTLDIALVCKRPARIIVRLFDADARLITRGPLDDARRENQYSSETLARVEAVAPARQRHILPQMELEEEEDERVPVREPRESRGFFGRIGGCFGGIWDCIRSIFAGIGRLFSGPSQEYEEL